MIPIEAIRAVKRCVVHAGCADGRASAVILHAALPDAEIVEVYHNSAAHKAIEPEEGILFCDMVPWLPNVGAEDPVGDKFHRTCRLSDWVESGTIVLDHHEGTRDIVAAFGERGVFGENANLESGAALAWLNVLRPTSDALYMDETFLARFAAVRDTFRTSAPDWTRSCEVSEVLRFLSLEECLLRGARGVINLSDDIGPFLWRKKQDAAKKAAANAVRMTIAGRRIAVISSTKLTSDVAEMIGDASVGSDAALRLKASISAEEWDRTPLATVAFIAREDEARREEGAAIRAAFANAGVTPRDGETTLAMVERVAIEFDKAKANVARLDTWLTDEHTRARAVEAGLAHDRDEQRARAEKAEADLTEARAELTTDRAHARSVVALLHRMAADLAALRAPIEDTKETRAWEALKAIEAKIAPPDWGFDATAVLIHEDYWRGGAWSPEEFQFIATIRNLYPWLRLVIDRALVCRDNLNATLVQLDRLLRENAAFRAEVELRGKLIQEALVAAGGQEHDAFDTLPSHVRKTMLQLSGEKDALISNLLTCPADKVMFRRDTGEGVTAADMVTLLRANDPIAIDYLSNLREATFDIVGLRARHNIAEVERLTRELAEARVALVSAERKAVELAQGRPLSEPWNASAAHDVHALLHDDAR